MDIYKFGCIPSPIDMRDFITTAATPQDIELPSSKNWKIPIIRDQGRYGSCVGFGSAGLKNIQEKEQNDYVEGGFSPLFIYSLCKQEDGIPDQEGTYIRIALKNLYKIGISTEKEFPYSLLKSPLKFPPIPDELKVSAEKYKLKDYARIPRGDLNALKQAINISPVLVGLSMYTNFYSPRNGFINTPSGSFEGGHCVIFTGYDDNMTYKYTNGKTKKGFIKFANSWGTNWGDNGYGYIAYEDLDYIKDGDMFIYEMWSTLDYVPTIPEPVEPIKPIEPTKYYRVQVGAFKIKQNAQNMVERLKNSGFSTYIPKPDSDGLYRIQCGAFSIKENASKLQNDMINKGFGGAFIVYK